MHIDLITIGNKMPAWVVAGFKDYQSRLKQNFKLTLIEIPLKKRSSIANITRLIEHEAKAQLGKVKKNSMLVALDVKGEALSSTAFAGKIQQWSHNFSQLSLLVGGPEGLDPQILKLADFKWSLSNLTLPHPLVRIIVAEQIFRAFTILNKHPYHK